MRHLLYISTANGVKEADIADIAAQSRDNNVTSDITGFLLFNGRNFLQLLEGEQAHLLSLMNRLALDTRHSGIVKIVDQPASERAFPDWGMEWLRIGKDREFWRQELDAMLPPSLDRQIKTAVLNFVELG